METFGTPCILALVRYDEHANKYKTRDVTNFDHYYYLQCCIVTVVNVYIFISIFKIVLINGV